METYIHLLLQPVLHAHKPSVRQHTRQPPLHLALLHAAVGVYELADTPRDGDAALVDERLAVVGRRRQRQLHRVARPRRSERAAGDHLEVVRLDTLHHPAPLPPEHLVLLHPPLPPPQRSLQHAVPDHRRPQHRLAVVKAHAQRVHHRRQREHHRRIAQHEVDGRVQERRRKRLVEQVFLDNVVERRLDLGDVGVVDGDGGQRVRHERVARWRWRVCACCRRRLGAFRHEQ